MGYFGSVKFCNETLFSPKHNRVQIKTFLVLVQKTYHRIDDDHIIVEHKFDGALCDIVYVPVKCILPTLGHARWYKKKEKWFQKCTLVHYSLHFYPVKARSSFKTIIEECIIPVNMKIRQ